jgi:hypothetical protein
MANTWYVRTGEKQYGPFSPGQLQKLAQKGELQPEHFVSPDRQRWVKPSQVRGLTLNGNGRGRPAPDNGPQAGVATLEPPAEAGPPELPGEAAVWHVSAGGKQIGTYATTALVPLLRRGEVTADAMAWQSGMESWQPVHQIPELAPHVAAAPPPPPAAPSHAAPSVGMACFYHPGEPAVGTCNECSKAGCRRCMVETAGLVLCSSCHEQLQREIEEEEANEVQRAARSVRRSWILAGAGAFFGLAGISAHPVTWLIPLIVAYAFWSTYWGLKWLWPLAVGWQQRTGLVLFMGARQWIMLFLVMWEVALAYGMFGGAIYQYRKFKAIAQTA